MPDDERPAPANPLAVIAKQIGFDSKLIGQLSGLPTKRAERLLAAPPEDKAIADYLAVMQSLGVVMRIQAAPPIAVTVNYRSIDRLVANDAWRREVGLCPFCRCKADVLQIAEELKRRKLTLQQMADYFDRHFVMLSGYKTWSVPLVLNVFKPDKAISGKGKGSKADFICRFRHYAVSRLLLRLLPIDAAASLKYGFERTWGTEAVTIQSTQPIPRCAAAMIRQEIQSLRWFAGNDWICE